MSLQSDIKTLLEEDDDLMDVLTGGVHIDVEEINKQDTASAFDANGEIKPCALIKLGTELPLRSGFLRAVNEPFTVYVYQRQGYSAIEPAMDMIFDLLNEKKIGTGTWNIEFDIRVNQQRDAALDCPLGSLRFVAKRLR